MGSGAIPADFDPTERYRFALDFMAHSREGRMPWTERDPKDLRWPAAVAAIWYDAIDWTTVRNRIQRDPKAWRADINARTRARTIVAIRGP